MELLAWRIRQKKFLASGFTSRVCGPLNMCSNVTPIMPLAQPAYENVQSHSDDVVQKKKRLFWALEKFYKDYTSMS